MIAIVKQEGARKFIILSKGQVYLFVVIWCSKEYEFECFTKKEKADWILYLSSLISQSINMSIDHLNTFKSKYKSALKIHNVVLIWKDFSWTVIMIV